MNEDPPELPPSHSPDEPPWLPEIESPETELPDESHELETDLTEVDIGGAAVSGGAERIFSRRAKPTPAKRRGPGFVGAFRRWNAASADSGAGNEIVAVWVLVQVAAIGAAALRWRYWAKAGETGELLSLHFLLAVQLIVGTLIFPILLDRLQKAALALATSLAFDALAWLLTGVSGAAAGWAGAFVIAWLVGLGIIRWSAGAGGSAILRMIFTVWVIGGPIFVYLHAEFSQNKSIPMPMIAGGPVMVAFQQLDATTVLTMSWLNAGGAVGFGGILYLAGILADKAGR